MNAPAPVIRIVDDDDSMRAGIADLLASVGFATRAFSSVADFVGGDGAGPGCLILDIRMPGEGGLAFFQSAAFAAVALPVVFVSGHADIAMAVQAMRAGAVDFLAKPFADQALIDAVNRALAIDRDARATLADTAALRARFAMLTPGERAVAELVAAGLPNKTIAARLGVSEITVKVRRGHAMRKVGAATLPDLVRATDRIAPPQADTP